MTTQTIALFPLQTVLCPNGLLPLRVFETRYVDMVRDCMREETGFGVVLIRSGREVGPAATAEDIGTLARIVDWDQGKDGLLAITARGERKFRVESSSVQPNQLQIGEVSYLPDEPRLPVTEVHAPLQELLAQLIAHYGAPWTQMETHFEDARWLGHRLTELLPMDNAVKQQLLVENDPLRRLEKLQRMVAPQ